MIRILDDNKSLATLVNDNTNGLGVIQPISAIVQEELNGIYELDFQTSIDENRYEELKIGGLVSCIAGEKEGRQIFRISKITKNKNGIVDIHCKHITYDLNAVLVKPFSSTGAVGTKNAILNNIVGEYPFTMTTDLTNTTSVFTLDIPKSFRECLGGWEGSILDTFRCEYEFDNLVVKMNARRGTDTDVRIAYGKNLVDLQQEENIESTFNAIVGYVKTMDDATLMGDIQLLVQTSTPKVKIVDFSSSFSDDNPATKQKINDLALQYAQDNKINVPKISLEVSFVQLAQTEEYKDVAQLERVGLGDTVKISFPKLNVDASARVVKRTWNVALNRYDSIELGETKSNLSTAISNSLIAPVLENIDQNNSFMYSEMDQMASLIINGLGLHKTVERTEGGGYRYFLHNKPTLAESDTQYIFTSEGFLVSTDFGQTWNAGFDAQGNAVVNSLSTIVLKALEIYGSRITFGDINDKYITAEQYSLNGENVGVSFDGNGYVRFRPQETFSVYNKASDGTSNINSLVMNKSGSGNQPYILLNNNDINNNYVTANFVELDSYATSNRLLLRNNNTNNNEANAGNYILMNASNTSNNYTVNNYMSNTNTLSNQISITTSTSGGNYQSGTNLFNNMSNGNRANAFTMQNSQTGNYILLDNYDTNGSLAARVYMYNGALRLVGNTIRMSIGGTEKNIYFEDGFVKYSN